MQVLHFLITVTVQHHHLIRQHLRGIIIKITSNLKGFLQNQFSYDLATRRRLQAIPQHLQAISQRHQRKFQYLVHSKSNGF